MSIGLLLPYFLLVLVLLEEHYAMWFIFFFIIPLLDSMFYIEPPDKELLHPVWYRICTSLYFPSVFYSLCCSSFSLQNIFSFGILNNTLLCFADNMEYTHPFDEFLQDFIFDFMGFLRHPYKIALIRTICFLLFFVYNNNLILYLGSIFLGSVFYEYIQWVDHKFYPTNVELSYYGLADYTMFRFEPHHLPCSPFWVLFFMENGLKT